MLAIYFTRNSARLFRTAVLRSMEWSRNSKLMAFTETSPRFQTSHLLDNGTSMRTMLPTLRLHRPAPDLAADPSIASTGT
jgi:hypothetical protein